MITLQWAPLPGADIAAYRIYRSFIGFKSPIVDLSGLTLQLKLNGGATQTFNFVSGDPVAQINATISGGYAYIAASNTSFLLRSNLREAPGSVEIVGGTAMAALGLTARVITQQSENFQIAQVTANPDQTQVMTFDDPDGALQDFYALSVVNAAGNESAKTSFAQPILATGPLCVIEGLIMNLQGARIPDAVVTAIVQTPPEATSNMSGITMETIETLSGPDGRFSLAVLQGALIKLEIQDIKFSHMVTVPAKSYVFLNDLLVDEEYRYPLGYRGAN